MSFDYDDDGTEQTTSGKGNGLRAQLEAALAELKQVKEENSTLAGKVKQSDLNTLLNDLKVPTHIRKWMGDVEPTKASVDKWLAENGSDFGWKPNAGDSATKPEGQQETPEEAPAAQQESVLTPEDVAAYQRMQEATQSGGQPTNSDRAETAVATVASTLTGDKGDWERMLDGLRAQGIPIESSFG